MDWKQLESNSEVITNYVKEIGFDTSNFVFQDLLSIDDWAQDMIPKPALGLLFIFPLSEGHRNHKFAEKEKYTLEPQYKSPNLIFIEQTAMNACGTIGVFHILGNLTDEHSKLIEKDSVLDQFFSTVRGKSNKEAGSIFTGSEKVKVAHVQAVNQGQTNVDVKPSKKSPNNHFIAFVQKDGHLYELDGGKWFPINHGPTTDETFLADACKAAKQFMERDPESYNFGMIVLAPKPVET